MTLAQTSPLHQPDFMSESAPDLPLISLILPDLIPGSSLYLSGGDTARNPALLAQHGITATVNCALNLDINYVAALPQTADQNQFQPEQGLLQTGHGAVRSYRIGLIDGPGNTAGMLVAGVLLVEGALQQRLPERPGYPYPQGGNILIHCRAGRSRSVAIAALTLVHLRPDLFAGIADALSHIQKARELPEEEWPFAPKAVLRPLMNDAGRMLANMDPVR